MPGPLSSMLYIHTAIQKEADDFEDKCRELNWEDKSQISSLADKFKFYRHVLQVHEESEEEFMFPALDKRLPHGCSAYLFDHQHHVREYDAIDGLLAKLNSTSGREGSRVAKDLYRESIALNAVMDVHVTKENEILMPIFEEYFSVEEQGAVVGQIMGHLPPEEMQKVLPWMFLNNDTDGREGILREMLLMAPPQMFAGAKQLLSSTVPAEDWQEMVRRIPELA